MTYSTQYHPRLTDRPPTGHILQHACFMLPMLPPIASLLLSFIVVTVEASASSMSSKEETKDVDMADASAPDAEGEVRNL